MMSSLSPDKHAAKKTQPAENFTLRVAGSLGTFDARFVSESSHRFSCSARFDSAELLRASNDIFYCVYVCVRVCVVSLGDFVHKTIICESARAEKEIDPKLRRSNCQRRAAELSNRTKSIHAHEMRRAFRCFSCVDSFFLFRCFLLSLSLLISHNYWFDNDAAAAAAVGSIGNLRCCFVFVFFM